MGGNLAIRAFIPALLKAGSFAHHHMRMEFDPMIRGVEPEIEKAPLMQGSHVGIIGQLSTLFADFDAGGATNAISVPFADKLDNR